MFKYLSWQSWGMLVPVYSSSSLFHIWINVRLRDALLCILLCPYQFDPDCTFVFICLIQCLCLCNASCYIVWASFLQKKVSLDWSPNTPTSLFYKQGRTRPAWQPCCCWPRPWCSGPAACRGCPGTTPSLRLCHGLGLEWPESRQEDTFETSGNGNEKSRTVHGDHILGSISTLCLQIDLKIK